MDTKIKQLHYKCRRYAADDFLSKSFTYLNQKVNYNHEFVFLRPWHVLLLLKIVYTNEQYDNYKKNKLLDETYYKILEEVGNLEDSLSGSFLRDSKNFDIFFKNITFQQFIFQIEPQFDAIARQRLMFKAKNKYNKIDNILIELFNLNFKTFMQISLICLSKYSYDSINCGFNMNYFANTKYPLEKIESFLNIFTVNKDKLKDLFRKDVKKSFLELFIYKPSPLLKYPFIKDGNLRFTLFPHLAIRSFEYSLYDKLREYDSNRFMPLLGKAFENYVRKCFEYANLSYIPEKEQNKLFGNGKVVDFLITDKKTNFFIDAKAVEMSEPGKTTYNKDILNSCFDNSFIKAIEQALDIKKRIQNSCSSKINTNDKANYIIVITMKDFFIHNGIIFYNNYAKQSIDNLFELYGYFPLENIIFLSITHIEHIVELVKKHNYYFGDIIEFIKHKETSPSEKDHNISNYLRKFNEDLPRPVFLEDEITTMFNELYDIIIDKDK